MSGYRITKIVCPVCNGKGSNRLFGDRYRCGWCRGAKRLPVADAVRYADWLYTLAVGGYVLGDHNLDHANALKTEAAAICRIAEVDAPWIEVAA